MLFIFSMSYLMRILYSGLIYNWLRKHYLYTCIVISASGLLFFDCIPISLVLLYHRKNFNPKNQLDESIVEPEKFRIVKKESRLSHSLDTDYSLNSDSDDEKPEKSLESDDTVSTVMCTVADEVHYPLNNKYDITFGGKISLA